MNAQPRTNPDETRERIVETADELFRRLGYNKTAVADIAAELRMSPANIYRFFSSKDAIVEAICQRCLNDLEEKVWAVARSGAPASERVERMFMEILTYHKENNLSEQKVKDIVLAAIEHSWDVIRNHKKTLRRVLEMILRDGMEAGEFEAVDPEEAARQMMRSLECFTHPVLISQAMQEQTDIEADIRATIRFLLRAVTPRN
jgi:AcrR family transcriptional regulator